MTFQEQIDIIQAAKDGRRVTYISMYDGSVMHVCADHSFDFIHYTYTIEPLYKEREVIMVKSTQPRGDWWMPVFFHEMSGNDVLVYFSIFGGPQQQLHRYTKHRKLDAIDKGEA